MQASDGEYCPIVALVIKARHRIPVALLLGTSGRDGTVIPQEYNLTDYPTGTQVKIESWYHRPGKSTASITGGVVRAELGFTLAALCSTGQMVGEDLKLWSVKEKAVITFPLKDLTLPPGLAADEVQVITRVRNWHCQLAPGKENRLLAVVTAGVEVILGWEKEVAMVVQEASVGRGDLFGVLPLVPNKKNSGPGNRIPGPGDGEKGGTLMPGYEVPLELLPRELLAAMEAAVMTVLSREVASSQENTLGSEVAQDRRLPGVRDNLREMRGKSDRTEFRIFSKDSTVRKMEEEMRAAARTENERLTATLAQAERENTVLEEQLGTCITDLDKIRRECQALQELNRDYAVILERKAKEITLLNQKLVEAGIPAGTALGKVGDPEEQSAPAVKESSLGRILRQVLGRNG